MIPSLRYGNHKKMTQIQSFTGFESNLLTNLVSLFHCVVCNAFLLFSPSTRLISFCWRMSLSRVTVTMTVPCTCLYTTTLMRSSWSPTISWALGVHIGKMRMMNSMPCSEMTPTLPTLLARCSLWEGNHRLKAWWRHANKHHSVDNIVVDPRNSTAVFLNAMNDINW